MGNSKISSLLAVLFVALLIVHAGQAATSPDLNKDGVVNVQDLGIMLANWCDGSLGACPSSKIAAADINGDMRIQVTDLGILLSSWNMVIQYPAVPSGPSPANDSKAVFPSAYSTLNWADSLNASSYDIYFDNDPDPGIAQSNIAISQWTIPSFRLPLSASTTYYWKVAAKNSSGATAGPVWKFSTAPTPFPGTPTPTPTPTVTPTPTPTPPPGGDLPHKTDFLTLAACSNMTEGIHSSFYTTATAAQRQACRTALKNKGYTHIYMSITSNLIDWFSRPASEYKVYLQELVNAGIKPVVFLTSDTGTWRNQSVTAIKNDLSLFIPQINSLVSSYVLGIEIEEYWSEAEADAIGNHMQTLTNKPVAAHQLPGKWNYCVGASWCDQMLLQYGWSLTDAQIRDMTTRAKSALGKPVVAAEYNRIQDGPESQSIHMGNVAVSAGAAGFGNGGTP